MTDKIRIKIETNKLRITSQRGPRGPKGDTGPKGDIGPKGDMGFKGESSYAVAVENGYTGTYEQHASALANIENITFNPTGDVVETQVLTGKTFYSDSKTKKTGTMQNRGSVEIVPLDTEQAIGQGYHDGTGKVLGVSLTGDVTESDVTSGKTFYNNGLTKKTGTMRIELMNGINLKDYKASVVSSAWAICQDASYLYIPNLSNSVVNKISKADLSIVATAPAYGGQIWAMTCDETHVYVGGDLQKVKKYLKSDMTLVGESITLSGTIRTMLLIGDYIYVGGGNQYKLYRFEKSNLGAFVLSTSVFANSVNCIVKDNDYMYCSAGTFVYKVTILNMETVAQSANLGNVMPSGVGHGPCLVYREGYVYASIYGDTIFKKLSVEDMSVAYRLNAWDSNMRGLFIGSNFIYVPYTSGIIIVNLNDYTVTYAIRWSSSFGNYIAIEDGNKIYCGSPTASADLGVYETNIIQKVGG